MREVSANVYELTATSSRAVISEKGLDLEALIKDVKKQAAAKS